ncbi:MAG TPA: MBL fold metallo-hydrolase [Spirochaetia bacterium]|nr:MBL fold metallo-hydrolase [Spirochaetia bacterium]
MADKIQSSRVITDNFYIFSFGFVCMYLLRAGESYLAFDTGMRPNAVLRELKTWEIDPRSVRHVFLTHADTDHVGGLKVFADAAVYLPKAEESMFDHTVPRFFGFVYSKRPAESYTTLVDGQELRIGGTTVRCISTPGHTAGSMSFLVNGSILIVGDELNLKEGRAVLDRKFISIDNEKRRESILKLAKLQGIELLCTMHSGYSQDFRNAMKVWAEEGATR